MNCPVCQRELISSERGYYCPTVDLQDRDHMYAKYFDTGAEIYVISGYQILTSHLNKATLTPLTSIYVHDNFTKKFNVNDYVWEEQRYLEFPEILQVIDSLKKKPAESLIQEIIDSFRKPNKDLN